MSHIFTEDEPKKAPLSPETPLNKQPVQQFLNPQSMITPGVAGMLDLTISRSLEPITTPLSPHVTILHLLLIFGFVIGIIGFLYEAKLFQKIIFYFINSLIVYCVAYGLYAATPGTTLTTKSENISTLSTRVIPPLSPP